jgi:uncharacterized protein (TIGR02996 family)
MEQQALLSAIRAQPNDRTARLVYADWLDEHGDPLAEYIRAECAAEASPPGSPELTTALRQMLDVVRAAGRPLGGWEYGPELERLGSRLNRLRPLIGEREAPREPLRESEIDVINFELRHGVTLPGEYRAFVLHIGDEDIVRLSIPDLAADLPDLRTPFPHMPEVIARLVYMSTIHAGFDAEPPSDYDPDNELPEQAHEGCLVIGEPPGNGLVWLGVNGAIRGQVWATGDHYGPWFVAGGRLAGFFDWYEEGLNFRSEEYGIEAED